MKVVDCDDGREVGIIDVQVGEVGVFGLLVGEVEFQVVEVGLWVDTVLLCGEVWGGLRVQVTSCEDGSCEDGSCESGSCNVP